MLATEAKTRPDAIPAGDPPDAPSRGEATRPGEAPVSPSVGQGAGLEGERPNGPPCELCGHRIDTMREPYSAGRGKTILGPEYAGRVVAVHEWCSGWADEMAGF